MKNTRAQVSNSSPITTIEIRYLNGIDLSGVYKLIISFLLKYKKSIVGGVIGNGEHTKGTATPNGSSHRPTVRPKAIQCHRLYYTYNKKKTIKFTQFLGRIDDMFLVIGHFPPQLLNSLNYTQVVKKGYIQHMTYLKKEKHNININRIHRHIISFTSF